MTKTHILCLANSKKYGERCIAGIEMRAGDNGLFHFVKQQGRPKWIRPVSSSTHGEVPASWVQDIRVGDIVEMIVERPCPRAYQTENLLFRKQTLRVVRPALLTAAHLAQLAEEQDAALLGNAQNRLAEDEMAPVDRSLVLVKADCPKAYFTTPYNTKPRIQFRCGPHQYDLPMTDVNFFDRMQENPALLEGRESVFVTVSLGVRFEGKYYKLAAGVIVPHKK